MWTLSFNGLTVGQGTPYNVVELTGVADAPDIRSSDVNKSRQHGLWPGVDFLAGRTIGATLDIDATQDLSVWEAFKGALVAASSAELPLVLNLPYLGAGEPVACLARVRRLSVPVDRRATHYWPQANIEWFATDPRLYSVSVTSLTADVASQTGAGLTFDAAFDLSFGGPLPSGVVNLDNVGNFDAPWVAEITGPTTDPRIESITLDRTLSFSGTVQAGQVLRVDSATKTATLDGSSRYSWLVPGSQWFDLMPGANEVRVAASAGSGQGTLTFRSAWI